MLNVGELSAGAASVLRNWSVTVDGVPVSYLKPVYVEVEGQGRIRLSRRDGLIIIVL